MADSKKSQTNPRYIIKVNLISARKVNSEVAETKKYYFEVGKKRKQRTPTMGYFEFSFPR